MRLYTMTAGRERPPARMRRDVRRAFDPCSVLFTLPHQPPGEAAEAGREQEKRITVGYRTRGGARERATSLQQDSSKRRKQSELLHSHPPVWLTPSQLSRACAATRRARRNRS